MKNCMISCIAGIAATLAVGCGTRPPSEQQNAGKASGMSVQNTIELGGDVKLEMVLIPAGSFVMGDDSGLDDEKPVHKVRITKPFYIGVYEVTQAQYEKIMGENPSHFKGPNRPVERVAWNNAVLLSLIHI